MLLFFTLGKIMLPKALTFSLFWLEIGLKMGVFGQTYASNPC